MQSCHHHAMTILRTSSYVDRDTQGGYGGWVGGGDNNIRYDIHHVTLSSPSYHHAIIIITQSSCHHHAISNLRISSYVDRDTQGGYGGGIIAFGTTYIMSLCHHHHIITQSLSSCNHHATFNLRISSYVDRDMQGGYRGVGGWGG